MSHLDFDGICHIKFCQGSSQTASNCTVDWTEMENVTKRKMLLSHLFRLFLHLPDGEDRITSTISPQRSPHTLKEPHHDPIGGFICPKRSFIRL